MMQHFWTLLAESWPYLLLIAAVSYLLGSVNFAILVTRAFAHRDIRDYGSGNAGATNVLRSQGKLPAALTTLGDVAKSIVAVLFGGWLLACTQADAALPAEQVRVIGRYVAGLFCLLGHVFPLYFGFRGGKGVLVALGMLLVLDWRVALLALAVFAAVVALSRTVSLGSLCAAAAAVVLTAVFDHFVYGWNAGATALCTACMALVALVIFLRHRDNLRRIARGTENKLSFKRHKEE